MGSATNVYGPAGSSGTSGSNGTSGTSTPTPDNSVSYVKLHPEFKTGLTIATSAIDWSTGFYQATTLTASTTYTFTNLEQGKTIVLKITGNYTLAFPATCKALTSTTYDGTKNNVIFITCVDSTTPLTFYSINTYT